MPRQPSTRPGGGPAVAPRTRVVALRIAVAVTALVALGAATLAWGPVAPAGAASSAGVVVTGATTLPDELQVVGHGWGHGRGMGQYGAFGYATGRSGGPWSSDQILAHYYGGTTSLTLSPSTLSVLIAANRTKPLVADAPGGVDVLGVTEPTVHGGARVTQRVDGRFDVQFAESCTPQAWGPATVVDGPVWVAAPNVTADSTLLRNCTAPGGPRYRGALVAVRQASGGTNLGVAQTVNWVSLEDYVRGVVPAEMPAWWGDAEGGRGMAALESQAVAARSYAAAGDARWGDYHSDLNAAATTCDTTSCQVYAGALAEHPNSNAATSATAGEVRAFGTTVARTEFSSSTGGYTAGGTFPAVPDEGDAVALNSYHDWSTTIVRADIESRYGLGTLVDARVTERNGYGDMGGRVQKLRLTGTDKTVEVTGNGLRSTFGLRSDWFDLLDGAASLPPPVAPRLIGSSCPQGQVPSAGYTDVEAGTGAATYADCATWWAITFGTGPGTFSPAGVVSRAQLASFVAREIAAAGAQLPDAPPDAFDDDDGSVHEHAINQLAAVGVVTGTAPRRFEPGLTVTRAQGATMVSRALDHSGLGPPANVTDPFVDDESSVHEGAINRLAAGGIVTGVSQGYYQPAGQLRRVQVAAMTVRALDWLIESNLADPHA